MNRLLPLSLDYVFTRLKSKEPNLSRLTYATAAQAVLVKGLATESVGFKAKFDPDWVDATASFSLLLRSSWSAACMFNNIME